MAAHEGTSGDARGTRKIVATRAALRRANSIRVTLADDICEELGLDQAVEEATKERPVIIRQETDRENPNRIILEWEP